MDKTEGDFVRHPILRRLFRYWLGLSRDGRLPLRRNIDALALGAMLPNLQLIDVGKTPDDLRYRLVGGKIVDAFGFEPGGLTRGEIRRTRVSADRHADFDRTSRETHAVATRRLVSYTQDHMTSYDRDLLAYVRLLLPISEDGVTATGIFGGLFMATSDDPFWRDFVEFHIEIPIEEFGLR